MLGTSKNIWGFDPRSVPGCALWLDAADQSSLVLSGSNVTQWNDKSGNGFNASSQLTAATSTQNAVNGLNSISFNGTSRYLTSVTGFNNSAYTIFVVQYTTSITGAGGSFGYQRTVHGSTGNQYVFIGTYNGNVATFSGSGSAWNDVTANSTNVYNYNSSRIVCMQVSGSILSPYTDGSSQTTKTGTTGSFSSFYIGNDNATTQPWYGFISEIIMYNSALTTSQRQQVEGYLAWKWGLTTSVPSIHPFSSIRPHLRTFQPTDIPGCQLWLDAADNSTLVLSGSNVTQWNDKSGNGNNGTANTPVALNSAINNLPALTFTTSEYIGGNISITGNTLTVFSTFKVSSLPQFGRVISLASLGGNDYNNTSSTGILNYGSAAMGPMRVSQYVSSATPLNTSVVHTVYFDGTNAYVYTNGGTPSSMSSSGNFSVSRYNLGRSTNTGDTYSAFSGFIGEVIIYNTLLTTSQRQQIEGYLAHKWGISISATLPSLHPFKSFPPAKAPMIIGLVNRWIFNNGSGSTVTDTVGGQNISLSGTYTWSSSVPNSEIALGSLSFNGYTGTGSASPNATLQTSTYTMTLWYYHTGISDPRGGNPIIIESGLNQNEAFAIATGGFTGTAQPYFYSSVYNGGFYRPFSSATPLNTWTHLAVTIGNSRYNAYQNGVLDSGNTNISITSGLPFTLNGSFIFGKGDNAYGDQFGGSLFDVRIYNRALSASEISQIYNGIG